MTNFCTMNIKLNILALCLIIQSFVIAQNSTSEKIIQFLGNERYLIESESNPGLIKFLESKILFGFEVIDYNPAKEKSFKNIESISLISKSSPGSISVEDFIDLYNKGTLNILLYNIPISDGTETYYKLGNTGKALIMRSVQYINSKISQ
jgi:hypothetical protein